MPNIHGASDTCAFADVLAGAASLIADSGSREHAALEQGILLGFGRGWVQGLAAGAARGTSA